MGKQFGQLYKMSGIVFYHLSPFEQRAFAGAIKKGVPNIFRRIREEFFYIAPPVIVGYIVYDQATKQHEKLTRKNPKDYENDV